jgi:hypothetical protein
MQTLDYLPGNKDLLSAWTINYDTKILLYAAMLGITPAELVAMTDRNKDLRETIANGNAAQNTAKQANAATDTMIVDYKTAMRLAIKGFKANPNFTTAMGEDLGISGTHIPFDPNTYKAGLSAVTYPGHVTLKFPKNGVDGVNIYSRAKGDPLFVKLSFDSSSPYIDNRPLKVPGVPETREYMAIGVIDDVEVGQASNIVEVAFGG